MHLKNDFYCEQPLEGDQALCLGLVYYYNLLGFTFAFNLRYFGKNIV